MTDPRLRTLIAGAALIAAAAAGTTTARALPPDRTVVLDVRRSSFMPDELTVQRGQTVHFVVRNADEIDHELIVGGADVHERHESGREARHPPVPGEVSVPLLSTATTSYTFSERGTVSFGCHLPGHWAYGMRGTITVS